MEFGGHTVLVTGGATGIGFGIARHFAKAGSTVIACGRREDKLRAAASEIPGLQTRACDLADEAGRVELRDWAIKEFPKLDVLVNNAGVQQRLDIASAGGWEIARAELAINLDAPIHLSMLFIPHLRAQHRAAIINLTSGLSFIPLARAPVYSSTKAALHSFTLSLRRQLADTNIEVVEIIPPAVDTDLGGAGLHKGDVPRDEFVDAAAAQIDAGLDTATYGFSDKAMRATFDERTAIFNRMNQVSGGS